MTFLFVIARSTRIGALRRPGTGFATKQSKHSEHRRFWIASSASPPRNDERDMVLLRLLAMTAETLFDVASLAMTKGTLFVVAALAMTKERLCDAAFAMTKPSLWP
ncbi:MAG: hypothetical protein EWM45_00410 [Rhodopseudomonas palustris]|nr:MAG: hypothetical protein EWM45_00410 [Rhodopseudomonas palustris]